MKQFIWIIVAILGVVFVGCKTSYINEKGESFGDQSGKQVFIDCLKNNPDYETYSAKASFVLTTNAGNLKSKAVIRIVKDKLLQISVQPFLGIEMFRVRLTNDSVWILDKMGRRYIAESIAAYKANLPVDLSLSTIQSLFLGQPFLLGKDRLEKSDYRYFSWTNEKTDWIFSVKDLPNFSCSFVVDKSARLTQTSISNMSGLKQINWIYSDFINQGGIWMPSDIEVKTKGIVNKDLSLKIENIAPEWNKVFDTSFSISAQYKKISVQDLLNVILK